MQTFFRNSNGRARNPAISNEQCAANCSSGSVEQPAQSFSSIRIRPSKQAVITKGNRIRASLDGQTGAPATRAEQPAALAGMPSSVEQPVQMFVLELPPAILWQICMCGGASVLMRLSQSCAMKVDGVQRNVINADKEKLRHCIRAGKAFAKFRDALLMHLPDGYKSKKCRNVKDMTSALLQLSNDLVVFAAGGWKQWNQEYTWCLLMIRILTTIGGRQRFAWNVREMALLYLEDSERDGCQRAAEYLEQLHNRARVTAAVVLAAGHQMSDSFRNYEACVSRHLRLQCEAAIVAGDHRWITDTAPQFRRHPRFFYLESACTTPYAPSDSSTDGFLEFEFSRPARPSAE